MRFPFIDLTRMVKEFIILDISLICDCYIYNLSLNLNEMDRLITTLVKNNIKNKKTFISNSIKNKLISKYFVVNIDDFEEIEIHKVMLNKYRFDKSNMISKLVNNNYYNYLY